MQNFGDYISGGKTFPLVAELSPTLIVKSLDTFVRQFLEAPTPKAWYGDTTLVRPYLKDALLFDGSPIPFNAIHGDPHRILEAQRAIWDYGNPTVQIDKDLLTAILALKETNGTLFQLVYLFISDTYRQRVLAELRDPVLEHYWSLYDAMPERDRSMIASPILNRLMPLVTDKNIRRIISQKKTFDTPGVLLVDLPRERRYDLLAALIMSQRKGSAFIQHPLLHIGDSTPIVHVDHLGQLPSDLKDKLLNTATIMTTRTGVVDAEILEPHFNLVQDDHRITDLPDGRAYVRMEKTHYLYTNGHTRTPRKRPIKNKRHTPVDILDDRTDRFIKGL